MIKVLWHDGVGMSLYLKRLEHGRFIRPRASDGAVAIAAAQLVICWKESIGVIRVTAFDLRWRVEGDRATNIDVSKIELIVDISTSELRIS